MVPLINVFNHLVLPLKLPNAQDDDVENTSIEITSRLIHATSTMSTLAGPDQASTWLVVRRLLRRCHSIHAHGRLEKMLLVPVPKHSAQSAYPSSCPRTKCGPYLAAQHQVSFVAGDLSDCANPLTKE
jgi:hypothetical protein